MREGGTDETQWDNDIIVQGICEQAVHGSSTGTFWVTMRVADTYM